MSSNSVSVYPSPLPKCMNHQLVFKFNLCRFGEFSVATICLLNLIVYGLKTYITYFWLIKELSVVWLILILSFCIKYDEEYYNIIRANGLVQIPSLGEKGNMTYFIRQRFLSKVKLTCWLFVCILCVLYALMELASTWRSFTAFFPL